MMKKIYLLTLSLFVAAGSFAQTTITYGKNALRAGDVRSLKQIEYQEQGAPGANKLWDYSQAAETKDMIISQASDLTNTRSNNLFLVCDEGGKKNTFFEISKKQKMYWGLENEKVTIRFNEPIVDLAFPFKYQDQISGIMDGTYTENEITNPINGTYTTQADAWGTLILPDGNIYTDVLRVKVEKNYTQVYQNPNIAGQDEEYQINTVRYQYFAKGVRYPVLIVLETEIKTDCKCACSNKTKEAFYETPADLFGEFGDDIISDNGESLIEDFVYTVSPNPFVRDLNISFTLKRDAKVEIDIIEMSGKLVRKVVGEKLDTGDHTYSVNTSNMIEGSYVLRIKVDKKIYTTKLVKKQF